MERLVGGRTAAAHLGVSYRTLMRWCDEGIIPFHALTAGKRRRRTIRFRLSELDAWVDRCGDAGGGPEAARR